MNQEDRIVFWRQHIAQKTSQKITLREYCRLHGLSQTQFMKWRTRFYGPMRASTAQKIAPPDPLSNCAYSEEAETSSSSVSNALSGSIVVRRYWSPEEKRRLVWEGLNSGMSFNHFSRKKGIHPSVTLRWLRKFSQPVFETTQSPAPAFASVQLLPEAPQPDAISENQQTPTSKHPVIEVETPNSYRIRISSNVDLALLRQVIDVLRTAPC